MKTLTTVSVVSVLCAASIWLFVAPHLIASGMVEAGGQFFELMVVLPTLVGVVTSLIGSVVGVTEFFPRSERRWAKTLMALGQALTLALAIAIVVWALAFGSTGWELLALPMSLMLGQIVVAAGLIMAGRNRNYSGRSATPESS
jgi:hypothetical protein